MDAAKAPVCLLVMAGVCPALFGVDTPGALPRLPNNALGCPGGLMWGLVAKSVFPWWMSYWRVSPDTFRMSRGRLTEVVFVDIVADLAPLIDDFGYRVNSQSRNLPRLATQSPLGLMEGRSLNTFLGLNNGVYRVTTGIAERLNTQGVVRCGYYAGKSRSTRPVADTNEYGFWQIDGRDMD